MKHASNLINLKNLHHGNESRKSADLESMNHNNQQTFTTATSSINAEIVWTAMSQIYGNRWIIDQGESPSPIWAAKLTNLSRAEIEHGINKLLDSNLAYTPNLSQFLGFCKIEFVEDVYKRERETQIYLENIRNKQKTDSVKKAALAEIKQMYGVKS